MCLELRILYEVLFHYKKSKNKWFYFAFGVSQTLSERVWKFNLVMDFFENSEYEIAIRFFSHVK